MTWANSNSYVEGIVRGYRNTLLTAQNYSNLTQCETIDGKIYSRYQKYGR
jgi:V-type H+-transporting ATPase subunit d